MNRLICMLAVICVCLSGYACGSESGKVAPNGMESTLPGQNLAQVQIAENTSSNETDDDIDIESLIEMANKLYQKNVYEMYERLGEPESKQISPSCIGKGDDGVYTYKNIIVYTYSEGAENIISVSVVDNSGEEIYCIPES